MKKRILLSLLTIWMIALVGLSPAEARVRRRMIPLPKNDTIQTIVGGDTLSFSTYDDYAGARWRYLERSFYQRNAYRLDSATNQYVADLADTLAVNRLFLPAFYYQYDNTRLQPLDKRVDSIPNFRLLQYEEPYGLFQLRKIRVQDSIVSRTIYDYCIAHPDRIHYFYSIAIKESLIKEAKATNQSTSFSSIFKPEEVVMPNTSVAAKGVLIKPRKWNIGSAIAFDIKNSYISDNWYQGGESSTTLTCNFEFKFWYTNYKNIEWTNELYSRTGFYATPNDTVNKLRVTDDLFRFLSVFKLKAFNKFNYTVSAEFKTKFFDAHKANNRDLEKRTAAFLSPAEFYSGIGLAYTNKFPKAKIDNMDISFEPLTYSMKYRKDLLIPVSGIEKDENFMNTLGSSFRFTMQWSPLRNFFWKTRLFYFTNYEKAEAEWENTLEFAFNRFFGTQIYFIFRWDDGRTLKGDDDRYLQFKENLGLKFTYRFK